MNINPSYVEGFHPSKTTKTRYKKLGKTDMTVSTIGLGTSPFGKCFSFDEKEIMSYELCEQITLKAIKEHQINYIDTAPWYGHGLAESILAKILSSGKIPRNAYYLATKIGRYEKDLTKMFDFSYNKTIETVENQLKIYNIDYIDLIQIHDPEFIYKEDPNNSGKFVFDPDFEILIKETLPALQKLREEGKIKYIGINGYPLTEKGNTFYEKVITGAEKIGIQIDTIFTYSRMTMVEQSFPKYYAERKDNLLKNVGIINAAPTALGMFTPQGPQPWHPAPDFVKDLAKQAIEITKSEKYKNLYITTLALKYDQIEMMPIGNFSTTVISCTSLEQAEHNYGKDFSEYEGNEKECIEEILELFRNCGEEVSWEGVEPGAFLKALNEM